VFPRVRPFGYRATWPDVPTPGHNMHKRDEYASSELLVVKFSTLDPGFKVT
jgi:hypothetical protein